MEPYAARDWMCSNTNEHHNEQYSSCEESDGKIICHSCGNEYEQTSEQNARLIEQMDD